MTETADTTPASWPSQRAPNGSARQRPGTCASFAHANSPAARWPQMDAHRE